MDTVFSVVILHFRQEKYLKNAIDSVTRQDCPSFEIIVADDHTPGFDPVLAEKYFENCNIPHTIYSNEKNIGTVANLNKALSMAKGRYIMFFAADDALKDEKVLIRFSEELDAYHGSGFMVSAQAEMMDESLEARLGYFVDDKTVSVSLDKTLSEREKAFLQHRENLYKSCFAIGTSAFIKERFLEYGGFPNDMRLIEDWSFLLDYTGKGMAVHYVPFTALLHRAGGISEGGFSEKLQKIFERDLLRIYYKRVLPYFSEAGSLGMKADIMRNYKGAEKDKLRKSITFLKHPVTVLYILISKFRKR